MRFSSKNILPSQPSPYTKCPTEGTQAVIWY